MLWRVMIKKILFVLFILLLSLFSLAANESFRRTKIAIFPFHIRSDFDEVTIELLYENFIISMIDLGEYYVVDKETIDNKLTELNIKKGKEISNKMAIEVGKSVGADIVLIPNITNIKNDCFIYARGIDVDRGDVVVAKSEMASISNKTGLLKLLNRLSNALSTKISGTKFNSEDRNFIKTFYDGIWAINIDSYDNSLAKYKQCITAGIVVTAASGVFTLAGLAILSAGIAFMCYPTNDSHDTTYSGIGWFLFVVALPPAMVTGAVILPFCSIPFWFASMIKRIYKKSTGKDLAFFDRLNFDAGFVMQRNNLNGDIEQRVNFSLSISL